MLKVENYFCSSHIELNVKDIYAGLALYPLTQLAAPAYRTVKYRGLKVKS